MTLLIVFISVKFIHNEINGPKVINSINKCKLCKQQLLNKDIESPLYILPVSPRKPKTTIVLI